MSRHWWVKSCAVIGYLSGQDSFILPILDYPLSESLIPSNNVWFQKISTPPHGKDWKFQRGGGSRVQEIPEGGGGGVINNIFVFADRFHNSDMFNFRLFTFYSRAADAKINLVNSTKWIFSLWLRLISVAAQVRSFSQTAAGKRSPCCGNKTSKFCKLHSLECLPHIFNYM